MSHMSAVPVDTRVVIKEGRVAIVRTPRGYFLPGGGAECGESLAEAAIRETKEKTGLIIEVTGEIGTADEYVHSPGYAEYFQKICTFFSAKPVSIGLEHEADHELVWTATGQAASLLSHASQKWAITKLFDTNKI